jgi:hypothetical protein
MRKFFKFVNAVRGHWEAIALGGMGTIVVGFSPTFLRWIGDALAWSQLKTIDSIPATVLWGIGLIGIFCACFLAWRDQYTARVDALVKIRELSEPQLQGSIEQIAWGTNAGALNIFLNLTISNLGAPSIVDNYDVSLVATGRQHRLRIYVINIDCEMGGFVIHPQDQIYDKTMTTPLVSGMRVRGWLRAMPSPDDAEAITSATLSVPGTQVVVSFGDIRNVRTAANFIARGESQEGAPMYYPDGSYGRSVVPVVGQIKTSESH